MKLKKLSLLLSVSLLLINSTAHSQDKQSQAVSQVQDTTVTNSQRTEAEHRAQQWQLKPAEWQRYQQLMDGPLGVYSPGLDPLTALGISARNEAERRYYARLQVIAESKRMEQELAYQRAYDEAFRHMYPTLLPVNFALTTQASPVVTPPTGNGRLAVFVRDNCPPCEVKVKALQRADQVFDLYMVGPQQDDMVIRRWATKVGIDPQKVFSKTITLNHDAGRWNSLHIGGELPAAVKQVGGKWQRQ